MIELTYIRSPFCFSDREVREVDHARTIRDLHEREFPGEAIHHYIVDGIARDPSWQLGRNQKVIAIRVPEGFIGPIIFSTLLSAAIGTGLSFLVSLLIGPPGSAKDREQGSPTYGWNGIQNTTTQGSPIPIVFGEHRVGGQVIAGFRRCENASSKVEHLYMQVAVGRGPIYAIGQYDRDQDNLDSTALPAGLLINKLNPEMYRGIECWLRTGRETQWRILQHFDDAIQPYLVDVQLNTDDWLYYKPRGRVKGLQLNLHFPRGIHRITSGGDVAPWEVHVRIQYRKSPNASWRDVPGGTSDKYPGAFKFVDETIHPFTRTVFANVFDALPDEQPEMRIRSITSQGNEPNYGAVVRLQEINEVIPHNNPYYPNIAYLSFRIEATEQLSGSPPTISPVVRGQFVPVLWSGPTPDDPPQVKHIYSTNPAWIAAWIALDKKDGLGNWFTAADLDLASFTRFANHCAEVLEYREPRLDPIFVTEATESISAGHAHVILTDDEEFFDIGDYVEIESEGANQIVAIEDLGSGKTKLSLVFAASRSWPDGFAFKKIALGDNIIQKRAECNIVFDTRISAWEALQRVCRIGRGVPYRMGRKLAIRIERDGPPVQHVNEASMIAGTFRIDYIGRSESPDVVEVQFLAKDLDYERDVEKASITRLSLDRAEVVETINLDGITDRHHARREANYYLRTKRLVRKKCEFAMPIDGIAMEPGDHITIGSVLPGWSEVVSIANGTLASFTLDHDLVLEPGETYVALIRRPGKPEGQQVTITSDAGTYSAGSEITTNGENIAIIDAPCTIGRANSIVTHWRVIETELQEDLSVKVKCVEYVDDVYRLVGWPLDKIELPPDTGCISPGSYFTSFEPNREECPPPGECGGIPCEWMLSSTQITITGEAADCVTVTSINEAGVTWKIEPGCSGSFCIEIEACFALRCCPEFGPCCQSHDLPTCGCITKQYCYTIC